MEEIREELPNFSIGIDLLGPDPTSSKNKAEKTEPRKFCVSQICRRPVAANFGRKTFVGNKKVTNWSLTTFKGKISVFIIVFKFVQPGE